MDVTNIIINISISAVAGGAAGLGLFKLLSRGWLQNWFAKDLENHKSELEAKNKEIQSRLDTKLALLQIKETQLYEKRLDAIKEVYICISDIYCSVHGLKMIKNLPSSSWDETTNKNITEKVMEFYKNWSKYKLYFSKDLANNIEKSLQISIRCAGTIMLNKNKQAQAFFESCSNTEFKDLLKELNSDSLDNVFLQVEREFRMILGIENKEANEAIQ